MNCNVGIFGQMPKSELNRHSATEQMCFFTVVFGQMSSQEAEQTLSNGADGSLYWNIRGRGKSHVSKTLRQLLEVGPWVKLMKTGKGTVQNIQRHPKQPIDRHSCCCFCPHT